MGRGLIGINLEECMKSILKGEVSLDDISVIHDDYVVSNDDDKYGFVDKYFCEKIAREIAKQELGSVTNRTDLENIRNRTAELVPQIQSQADKLLQDLVLSGKVREYHYKVPKGQEHEVQIAHSEYITDHIETITNPKDRYYFRVGEQNYSLSNDGTSLYDLAYHDKHIWYDNELQVIAELLKHGNRPSGVGDVHSSQKITGSAAMAKLLFPQYSKEINSIITTKREIIETTGDSRSDEPLPGMDYAGILQKLEELVQQRSEHSATEIGEGVSDIKLDEFTQGLQDIISEDITKEQSAPTKE